MGIGTQDDLAQAESFVANNNLTIPVYWEGPDSYETWFTFGIVSQPAVVLLDSSGNVLDQWLGAIPEDKVLEIVGNL